MFPTPAIRRRNRGFSLVELMVGLLVGLIIALAITASVGAIGKQLRTTTGGAAAQESAQLALSLLDRSTRAAGAGLFSGGKLLCPSINMYKDGKVIYDGAALAPVQIVDGGDQGSDTVTVSYTAPVGGAGSVAVVRDMPNASSVFTVNHQGTLQDGDLALIGVPGSNRPCTLFEVTGFNPGGGNCDGHATDCIDILHNSGQSDYNPANPGKTFADAPRYGYSNAGAVIGPAVIMRLGPQSLRRDSWRVMCDTLVSYDDSVAQDAATQPSCSTAPLTFSNASAVAGDIVMMKAQYGLSDTVDSDVVTTWSDATGSWETPAAADIPRIRAVRIAVISRVAEPAGNKVVSDACTNAAGVENTGPCTFADADAPVVDLSGLSLPAGHTWQNYRYRVFSSVIPLRNIVWNY